MKSMILHHLQIDGATKVIMDLESGNIHSRNCLFQLIKGVLQCHDQGLKVYLELYVDGSCKCVGLAKLINDEKEGLFVADERSREAAEAHRIQREEERLPPVLKSSSEYWSMKEKAAQYLKRKQLKQSKKFYLRSKKILESHREKDFPIHQKDMQSKIGDEVGKIASNISMICLMSDETEEALEYASEAAVACPGWPKAHSRRALALAALERYNEAQVAIFNAIKRCERALPMSVGDQLAKNRKELKEYKKIKADIEAKMGSTNEFDSIFEGNPL
jgi:tetratricopeptide (TPR) repeat protein